MGMNTRNRKRKEFTTLTWKTGCSTITDVLYSHAHGIGGFHGRNRKDASKHNFIEVFKTNENGVFLDIQEGRSHLPSTYYVRCRQFTVAGVSN